MGQGWKIAKLLEELVMLVKESFEVYIYIYKIRSKSGNEY